MARLPMETDPVFRHRDRVRWADTDASGRIHFTAMFRWFEYAEQEFLRSHGLTLNDLIDERVNLPRVHVEANYRAALTHDDAVEIHVGVERVGRSSATLSFDVIRDDGELAGNGRVTWCAVDLESESACPLPDPLRRALESP